MKYELPKDKENFLQRYKLKEKIFLKDGNQYIRNYSGLTGSNFDLNNSFCNYLENGNINVQLDWEKTLENVITNFAKQSCQEDGTIEEVTVTENEINEEKLVTGISESIEADNIELKENINFFLNTYGKLFFNYLGTEEKLLMCKTQKRFGLRDDSTNLLSEVQFNSKILKKVADFTRQMFGKDIYLDRYTFGEKILFRVGDDFEFIRKSTREDNEVEFKLDDYKILDNEGDGIRNFVTSYLTLNLNDKNVILLDEPESFLHPPLANQLGEIIGESASDEKQIFISTHSVNLLKGIIKSCDDVNILRITRNGDNNKITILDPRYLEEILTNPLLVSSNVLNGLFCEKVYICESESDEEFYQILHDKVNLLDSALFVHGKNKQTLKDIAEVYNELGIENNRIYDFDILKDEDFNRAINKFIPNDIKNGYINLRKIINQKITVRNMYSSHGIRCITEQSDYDKIDIMFNELKEKGIIILRNGCLETNLEDLGISFTANNKNRWFSDAISLINNTSKEEMEGSYIYNWIFK